MTRNGAILNAPLSVVLNSIQDPVNDRPAQAGHKPLDPGSSPG